jgi:inorganic pyrophosphatase
VEQSGILTMQINSIQLHPEFPQKVWIVVEQPRDEPIRLAYDPATQTFQPTAYRSLTHHRGFRGVYGWIGGSGTPPQPHFDVVLLTDQDPQPGDVLEGYICGVFFRRDGDFKFVALDASLRHTVSSPDLSALDEETYKNLTDLYPEVGEGEGWHGAATAHAFLRKNKASHD